MSVIVGKETFPEFFRRLLIQLGMVDAKIVDQYMRQVSPRTIFDSIGSECFFRSLTLKEEDHARLIKLYKDMEEKGYFDEP